MTRTSRRGLGTIGIVITCAGALAGPSVAAEVLAPPSVTPPAVVWPTPQPSR